MMSRSFGRALVLVVAATLLTSSMFAATGEYRAVVLADNPAAYYPLDETSGATAFSLVGAGINGTYNNVTLGIAGALGSATSAGTFDGGSSYVQLPGTWGGSSSMTIEAWVWIDNTAGTQAIVASTAANFIHLQAGSGFNEFYIDGGSGQNLSPVPDTPINTWRHVALVITSGGSKLYVDGSQVASNASPFTSIDSSSNVRIGMGQNPGRHLNGRIDEVAIYNTALSPARILAHFNAQADGPITSVASGNWSSPATWSTGTVPTTTGPGGLYDNVVIDASHTVTVDTGGVIVNDLTVLGTLDVSSFGLTVRKDLTVDGTVNGTGYLGLYALTAGTQVLGTGTINAPVGFSDSGLTRTIASSGALTFTNIVTVDSSCTVHNSGTVTLTHASGLDGDGTWTQGSTGTLHVEGAVTVATFNAANIGNTVDFTGSFQPVRATTYHHLIASGNFEIRTLAGPITVNGDMTVDGSFHDDGQQITGGGAGTLTLSNFAELYIGTYTGPNSGNGTSLPLFAAYTFDSGSDVLYRALAAQTVSSTPIYGHLSVEAANAGGTYTKTADGTIFVAGTLSVYEFVSDVVFDLGTFPLNVGGDLDGAGVINTTGVVTVEGSNTSFTGTITPSYAITFGGGNAQIVRGTLYDALTINKIADTATLSAPATATILTLTAGTLYDGGFTLTSNGTVNLGANTTLRLAATMPAGTHITDPDSTVIYEANGPQTIDITPYYGNLIVTTGAAASTKTPSAGPPAALNAASLAIVNGPGLVTLDLSGSGAVVTGDVTGNGELLLSLGGALEIGGNFTHTGNFGPGAVSYTGNGAQIVRGTTYVDLTIDKSGGTATLAGNASVADELFILDGTLNLGSYALESEDVVLIDTPGTLELNTGILKISAYLIIDGAFNGGTTGELWITASSWWAELSGASTAAITVPTLRITDTYGMELDEFAGFDLTVTNLVDLSGGGNIKIESPRKMTIASTGSINRVAGAIQGLLAMQIPAGQTRRFETATYSSNTYSPMEITSSNAATINLLVTDTSATQKVDRLWTLSGDPSTLDLKYEWAYSGYTGDTRGFVPARFAAGNWTFPAGYVEMSGAPNYFALIEGVSAYDGDWTAGNGQFLGATVASIGSFDPTIGSTGTGVTLYGSNFTGATAVSFNGTPDPGFSVSNDNELYATVPSGATTGTIGVTTPSGTGTSFNNFTVANPQTIQTQSPGNWSSTATWQGGVVPSAWDNVVINHAVNVDVSATINDVQLNANLTGTWDLTVDGTMTWNTGTISNGGLTISTGSILSIATAATHTIDGAPLNNDGTINLDAASLYLSDGASLNNDGTININGDYDLVWDGAGAMVQIENADSGNINKNGGAGASALGNNAEVNSVGTITAASGSLNITSGITTAGLVLGEARTGGGPRVTTNPAVSQAFIVANGATMQFSSGATFNHGTDFSGSGTILITSAVEFKGSISASATSFVIDANATITWTASTFTGTLTWTQGSFTGVLTNAGGSIINAATSAGSRKLDALTFTNQGTFNLASAAVDLTDGAWITNQSGANINLQGDYDLVWDNGGSAATIQNDGTITKTAGSGTSSLGGGATFSSSDTLRADSGTLRVSSTGNIAGAAVAANPGTTVEFNNDPSFADGMTFTGDGTVLINSAATFTGNLYQTANLCRIDTTGTITFAAATFHGHLEWKDGTFTGDTLIVNGGSVWNVVAGPGTPVIDSLAVTSNGVFNLTGNSVALAKAASFTNQLTLDIQGDYDFRWDGSGAAPTINNTSTIKKSAGTGTAVLGNGASITHAGAIQADTGTLSISSAISGAGSYTANTGAIITFPSTASFNTGTIFGGLGTADINSNATFSGTITAGLGTTMIRGGANTITFNGATWSGPLTWKEATVNGTGLTIDNGWTLTVAAGAGTPKLDAGTITINGSAVFNDDFGLRNGAVFTVASGANVSIAGDYTFGYDGTGALPNVGLSGTFGKTAGTGTASISCGGVCTNTATGTIGAATGIFAFTSGLTSNGTLKFPINGPTPLTDFGRIAVTGTVTLSGTSTPEVNVSYVPDGGTAFQVMTFTSKSGDFVTKNYTFAGTRTLSDTYNANDLTLTASGPTITTLAPATGAAAGGTSVSINGTGFTGTTPGENFTGTVLFDSSLAPTVLWQSATQLTATTPAHAAGVVDVTVTNANAETHTAVNAFTFSAGTPPTITALSVSVGTTSGGTYVEISGTDLSAVTQVQFGAANATILSTAPTVLKVRTPAGAGTVNVTVTSPGGSDTLNSSYSYAAPLCDVGASGVVSWYRTEGDATDGAGGNDGAVVGTPSFTSAKVGQGVVLDSDDDAVTIPHSTQLDVDAAGFTVEFWMQGIKNQPGAQFLVVDKSHGFVDSKGWAMQGFGATGVLHFLVGRGGGGTIDFGDVATSDVLDGQLHHIAGVWDGANIAVYVDGLQQASAPLGGTPSNNTRPVNIGYAWGGGTPQRFFRGTVDELTIHNRALSGAEVLAIYDADTAGKCYPAIPTVHSISPASGTTAGGTAVTIEGSSMSGASVTIGNAISIGTNTQSQITGTTVATGAGTYNVNVSTAAGTGQLLNGYTFAAAASYTSVTSGNWTNPATWGSASYPQPGDTATVNHDVTVNANLSVANVTLNGSGTRLSGAFTLTVTGGMTWNGGDLGAAVVLDTGSISTITGATPRYSAGGITNNGTITFDATGQFTLHTNNFTNNGTFNLQSDATWLRFNATTFFNTASAQFNKTGGAGTSTWQGTFTNTGTMNLGSGTLTFSEAFNNSNLVNLTSGSLNLNGGGTTSGTFATGAGVGIVNYGASNSTFFGTFSGGGKLSVSGGTLTVTGGTANISNLEFNSGSIAGTSALSISNSFYWSGGNFTGSGGLNLGSSCTTTITGPTVRAMERVAVNDGTVNFDATGSFTLQTGSFTNNGTFNVLSDFTWLRFNTTTFTNASGASFNKSAGAGTSTWQGTFVNEGTMTLGSGTLTFSESFNNNNLVNVNSGTLNLNGSGTSTGTFDTVTGTAVAYNAGSHTFGGLHSSGGKLRVTGGAVTMNGAASSNFELTGGSVGGTALTIDDTFYWTNGNFTGAGVLILGGGCTTTITGASNRAMERTATNDGIVNFDATGTFTLQTGSFTNNATFNLLSNATWLRFNATTFTNATGANFNKTTATGSSTWQGTFVNDGTMTLDAGNLTFSESFSNNSQVTINSGTLNLNGGGTSSGTFTTAAGTAVAYNANASTFNATQSGLGKLQIAGATVTTSGTASATNLDFSSGSMSGAGTFTISNSFNWTGGNTVGGTGTITLGSSCNTLISGATARAMEHILNNQGSIVFTATGALTIQTGNFNNSGVVDLQVDGTWLRFNASWVMNTGTIKKTGGTGTFTMDVNTNNSTGGIVDVETGSINFTESIAGDATSHYKFGVSSATTAGTMTFLGTPNIAGAQLTAYVVGPFVPQGGQNWSVMSPVTGTFGATNTSFSAGRSFGVSYPGSNSVLLTASGPTIAAVSPAAGTELGGTTVTITGTGFGATPTVSFGGTAAAVTFDSATQLTATTPAHTAGTFDVVVTNPDGQPTTKTNAFTFNATPAPTVTAIRPNTGNVAGGTTVYIDGSGLDSVSTVNFDTAPATIIGQTATLLEVIAPPHAAGTVTVSVINPAGSANGSFTYNDAWDVARDFSRTTNPTGPWSYGHTPTRGGAFTLFTTTFAQPSGFNQWDVSGSTPTVVQNPTASPITHAGDVIIGAGTFGLHPGTPQHAVTRWTAPSAGQYEITGSFTGIDQSPTTTDVAVLVGGTQRFTAIINSYNAPQAFTLRRNLALGEVVEFTVSENGSASNDSTGLSATISPLAGPLVTVTNIVPAVGATTGGQNVTITGTNFHAGAGVTFGGVSATSITVVNANTITAMTPAHAAGAVDVVVTHADSADATLTSGYLYSADPHWLNPVSGNWNTAANWSTGTVPASGDTAYIDAAGGPYTVTFSGTNRTVAAVFVAGGGTLDVAANTLTLTSASTIDLGGSLILSGGTLTGAGTITVGGGFNITGGTLTTTLALSAGRTGQIAGNLTFSAGGHIVNSGTINWLSGNITAGNFQNTVIDNLAGATLDIQADVSFPTVCCGLALTINNAGTITKSGGTGTTSFGTASTVIYNQTGGSLNVNSGTVALMGGGSHTGGTINVASGRTLQIGHDFTNSATIAGDGRVLFSGGTTSSIGGTYANVGITEVTGGTINFTAASTTNAFTLSGGTLGGSGGLTVNGAATWSGGTLAGQLNIPATRTLTANGGIKSWSTGGDLNNSGTINWSAGDMAPGNFSAVNFDNLAGGTIDIQGDVSITTICCGPGMTLTNAGTITKSAGTATTSFGSTLTFSQTAGSLNANSGTIVFNGPGSMTGGSFNVLTGKTLQINGNLTSSGTIAGDGRMYFTAGTHSIGGTYSSVGITELAGGTTSFTSAATTDSLILSTGTLGGGGGLTTTGASTWSGGTLAGMLTIDPGVTLTISGASTKVVTAGADLNNNGTVDVTGTGVIGGNSGVNATFDNAGVWNQNSDIVYQRFSTAATVGTFNNSGTFNKNGSGTTTFDPQWLFNSTAGAVNINAGTFELSQGGTATGGAFTIAANAILSLGGNGLTASGATTFTGTGTLRFAQGTSAIVGCTVDNLAFTGGTGSFSQPTTAIDFDMSAGGLAGSGGVTITGTGNTWSAGTLSGVLNVNPGAILEISTGGTKAVAAGADLNNNGTVNVTGTGVIGGASGVAATIDNAGVWNQNADIVFQRFNTPATVGTFTNSGTFNKNATSTTTFDPQWLFNSTAGGVNINAGTFELSQGGTATGGAFTIAANAIFSLGGNGFTASGTTTFTGAGTLRFAAGTSTIVGSTVDKLAFTAGTGSFSQPTTAIDFDMTGGGLAGSGGVTITGTGNTWSAGTLAGVLTVNPGAILELNTGGTKVVAAGADLNNNGTVNVTGTGAIGGSSGANATIDNAGIWNHNADAQFQRFSTPSPVGTFNNSGTFNKNGTGTTPVDPQWFFNNTGTLSIASGTISMSEPYTQSGIGTLTIKLAGTGASQFGRLTTSGLATLAGTLNITYGSGYTPANGDAYQILSFGSRSGDFATKTGLSFTGGSLNYGLNATNITLTASASAAVSITKTAPTNVAANEVFTYTITVNNTGPDPAASVSVTDVMQAGMTPSNISAPSFTCSGTATLTCTAANLAAGVHTINFDVTAPSSTQAISNVANLTATNDSTPGDNSSTAVTNVGAAQADLAVTTTPSAANVVVGSSFTWTTTVTNNGPSPATNVALTNTLPAGQTITNTSPSAGTCNVVGNAVNCSFGGLAVGASANVVITVTADEGGTRMNQATATATETDGNNANDIGTANVTVTGDSILVVTNNNPGGTGSLAQALLDADAGVCPSPCAIHFNMPGALPIPGPLPTADVLNLTIDGTTQPGYNTTTRVPLIEIDGSTANPGSSGLNVDGDNYVIRGLAIYGFTGPGAAAIDIIGGSHTFEANWIGVKPNGTPAGSSQGIHVNSGANVIGSADPSLGNVIANNGIGIALTFGTGTHILGNSMRNNTGLAIDHDGDDVVEILDAGDADTGPNNHQNAPVISLVEITPTDLDVTFSVDSTSVLTTNSIRVEVFEADANGEPQTFLGAGCFAGRTLTNQLLNVPFGTVVSGDNIVATATSFTDGACATVNDGTSEVSAAMAAASCVPPNVTITGSPTVCAGGSVTLDAGVHTTYLWSPGGFTTQSINVSPASTTTYTVTVTDASGCPNSTTHTVTVNTPAAVNITGPAATCAGNSVILDAGPGMTYAWLPGGQTSQSITVTPTSTTTYSVTVTDANGCQTGDTHTVTVNVPAAVNITGPATSCAGNSITLDAGPGVTYAWLPGGQTSQTIIVSPTATTTYSVTVTDANGCAVGDSHTVTVNTPTPVVITGPTNSCAGNSVVLDAGPGVAYAWLPGGETSQTISVSPTSTTTYTATVTDVNGCQSADTHTVTVTTATPVNITGPATTCAGNSVVLDAGPGVSYAWLPGGETSQTITVSPSSTTTYSVTVTDANSCAVADTHTVTVNTPAPASITASGPTTFCTGGSVTLTASAGSLFVWSPNGETTPSITVTTAGTYGVTVTDANGCISAAAPVTVTVNNAAPVSITGPSNSCSGNSVALNATPGFANYVWQPGNLSGATVNVSPTSTTTYSLTATDANGCVATTTHTVTVATAAPVSITGPTGTCPGGSVTLTATAGFTSYLWQPGNLSGASITVAPPATTTYTLTATDAGGCTSTSSHTVTVTTPPSGPSNISASGPTTFCAGGSVVLTAASAASYLWSPGGQTTQSITVTTSGTYSVTANDPGGCPPGAAPPSVTVTVHPQPNVTITGPTATCATAAVTLDAGAGFNSYLWQPGNFTSQTINVNPSSTTTYTVTVTGAGGCAATDTHEVAVTSNPTATIAAPALICSGATGHTASVGTQPGATYAWAITNGVITSAANTPSITFEPTSLATVQLDVIVSAGSCTATGSTTVQVSPTPATPVITAPDSVGASTTGHTASIVPQAGAAYFWSITGGSINGPNSGPSVSFDAGTTSPVTLSVNVNINGCVSNASAIVEVDNVPAPVNQADVGITKSAPASVVAGTNFTYTINVVNAGPAATELTIVDTLPAGVTLLTVNGGSWDCATAGPQVTCTGSAFAGQFGNILITVRAPSQAATVTNTVAVTSSIEDPNTANNTDAVSTIVNVAAPTCPNAAPSLTFPTNGATNVASPVTLSWNTVASASLYDVWINTGGQLVLAGSTTSNSLSVSAGAGVSTWYVVAHGSNGCAALTSETRSFTVAPSSTCGSSAKPQIISPGSGAEVSSPATISWTAVPQAIGYRVWISVDGTEPQDVGTTNGAISLSANLPPGAISVSVDALFNACPPSRSDAVPFNVPQPDPCANRGSSTLLSPANNSQVNSSSVELNWNAPAGATPQQYRVWASVDGAAPEVIGTTSETSLREVFERGQVIWFVENLYPGCASTESPRFNFNIPARNECGNTKPALVSPAGNTTVSNGSVTFVWNALADAVAYEVWLALGNESETLIGTTTAGVTTFNYSVPPGNLKWHVRALIDRCPARESTSARFSYEPPAACDGNQRPIAISPIGTGALTAPADFVWSAPEGATRYELYAHRAAQPPALVASSNVPQANDVNLAAGSYLWFVRAFFDGCSPLDSAAEEVTIVAVPSACGLLAAPVISAPGQISSGIPFLIQWTPIAAANSYQFQVATNEAFANAEIINTTGTQHELVRTNNGNTAIGLYARVRAIDSRCSTPAASPYGPLSAVFVLPKQGIDGSATLAGAEPITYTINLGPQFAAQSFTAVPTQPWLSVAPASGVVPSGGMNLIVTADTSALGVGTSLGGVAVTLNTTTSGKVSTHGTTTVTTPVSVSLVTPVTPAPKNTPPPDALLIPAVANADGINSHFQSDVRVSNTSPQVMKYQLTYIPSGDAGISAGRQTTFSIEPGRTVALDDILKSWFGTGSASSMGTLEVRPLTQTSTSTSSAIVGALANLSTFASSRTFNVTPNGTFGQHIPAIPFANFIGKSTNSLLPTVLSLQQIAQSSKYRTNLGLMEGSGQPASLLVKVFGSNGAKITDFPVSLNGGQHMQLNGVLAQKGITTLSDGRIEVEVLSGGGKVTAYASVLDNETSDPLLVSPITLNSTGNTKWVVPGVADLNNGTANWQTDMRVFNAGTTPVNASLSFYSQNGGDAKTTNVTIPAGQVLTFDKTLSTVFGAANDGGAVHISTPADARLIATARTYNQTTQGTYGQFISAVTPLEAAGVGTRPLQLLQVEESDRFRSNIGLAEVTGNPAKLEISVVPPDAKFTARIEVDLGANEFRQIGSLLKTVGLSDTFNARVTVRVIEGSGRVAAYASVIDMKTNDPTYVPAQ